MFHCIARITIIMTIILVITGPINVKAQDVDEVTLTFGFPAVGQVYVNCAFRGDKPLLGMAEILSLLEFPSNRTASGFGFTGSYPEKKDVWEIDPVRFTYTVKGQKKPLDASKFFIGETDLYISPDLFQELFGLTFTINTYGLMLSLQTERLTPIEERIKRQNIRKELKSQSPENILKTYPMLYPRERKMLALGMLDYNVGIGTSRDFRQSNYSITGGLELLGGDFQGNFSGFQNSVGNFTNFSGVRWRYVFNSGTDPIKNPIISELNAGQLSLLGPFGGSVRGISINNTPIVPRRVLDLFAIEGFTSPDSEVELLIAGQIVDFTRADELGYYRFTTPLTYGTIRIGLRIYTPQGEVITEDRQLQIPFTFVPRGFVNYNIQAGYEEFAIRDSLSNNLIGHGALSYGLTNNITIRAGVDRKVDSMGLPVYTPYGSTSFRLFDQYLFNVDYLPNTFVRASGSVFYANNTTFNAQYSDYTQTNLTSEFVQTRALRDLSVSYFFPFKVFGRVTGIRSGLEQFWYTTGQQRRFQIDLNTRIGPIVSRLNYREELIKRNVGAQLPTERLITGTFTYTIPRTPGIPVFVRGMFFRTQLKHNMKQLDASALGSLQFSQTVFKRGRLTLGFDHDFNTKVNAFQIALLYDFNALRSSTQNTVRQRGELFETSFNQNISGSLAADFRNNTILPNNRDQVGRAGITVRMFVDNNANGKFDKGEEIIPSRAIRLDQSATMQLAKDGMLRISQLQSYWTYNLTVDVTALPDANLAPLKDKFSFVADPNRYKQIDIPLYRTGTIEGYVYRQRAKGAKLDPQPGLRLHLKREGDSEETKREVIRTFSDGGFYAYGLIPGNYTLLVDSGQLAFMGVQQEPDTLKFTIRALAEGDYIDTLEIRLVPRKADTTQTEEPPLTLAELERRLGDRLNKAVSGFIKSQENFYMGEYRLAYLQADSSLDYFYSDFALALKGSAAYLIGKKQEAWQYWSDARDRNPFIVLPDTSYLRSYTDTLTTGDHLARAPFNAVDSLPIEKAVLIADFEVKLGENLRKAITSFVEAQELFYRKRFVEAGLMVDSSLNYQITDHGLALKGSIAYVQGRRNEAIQLWLEARERNPHIILPDLNVLDRLMQPVAENTRNAKNASQLAP